jgi:hypothetical protein
MTQKTQVHASRPKWVVKKLNAASLLYLDDRVQRIIQFRKKIVVFFAATYKSLCFASFAYCVSLSFFVYREAFMFAFTCSSCKLSDKDILTHSRLAALYMRLPLVDPLQLF